MLCRCLFRWFVMLFKSSLSLLIFCLLVNTLLKGFSGRCGPSLRSSALCQVVGHARGRVWHFSGFPCSYSSEGCSGPLHCSALLKVYGHGAPGCLWSCFSSEPPVSPSPGRRKQACPRQRCHKQEGTCPATASPRHQSPVPRRLWI